jgi:hypothetical protein
MTEWPQEKADQAEALWRKGYSAGWIAARLGMSRSAVAGKIDRLGLKRDSAPRVTRLARPTPAASKPKPKIEPPIWISLVELERGMCRFPRDDGLYCGARTHAFSSSWCELHRKRVCAPQKETA